MGGLGVDFAVLHGLRDGADVRSDVDIVCRWSAPQARAWMDTLRREHDVHCVQRWQYDVDACSFFLMSKTGDGAQLDVMTGAGLGRYGFRADVALEAAMHDGAGPRVSPDDSLLYLLVKRRLKGDAERLAELVRQTEPRRASLLQRVDALFSPPMRSYARDALQGRAAAEAPRRDTRHQLQRGCDRIRHPAGWWWHAEASDPDVRAVAGILGRTLVRSHFIASPATNRIALEALTRVRRPGAVATRGPLRAQIQPHLTVAGDSAAELLDRLVAAAHARTASLS